MVENWGINQNLANKLEFGSHIHMNQTAILIWITQRKDLEEQTYALNFLKYIIKIWVLQEI